MPYIKEEQRPRLNPAIDELAERIVAEARQENDDKAFMGILNYAITRLALKVLRLQFSQLRYWMSPTVRGVLQDVSDEFYRRLLAEYEDKKIEENGDVDLYEEFLRDIREERA